MTQYQTEAILLAVRDWDEADRMVTLFSREFGKITAMAYGARRAKSSLGGCLQVFSHVDLALTPGRSADTVRQCQVRTSFRAIRQDLPRMAYASLVAELVAELWPDREAEPRVFDLLMGVLPVMSERNPRIAALAAAWQFLALAGYAPSIRSCVVCRQPVEGPGAFDPEAGGIVCSGCRTHGLPGLSPDCAAFLQRVLALDWAAPDRFTVSGAVLQETENLLETFITYHIDRPLKSLSFLRSIR